MRKCVLIISQPCASDIAWRTTSACHRGTPVRRPFPGPPATPTRDLRAPHAPPLRKAVALQAVQAVGAPVAHWVQPDVQARQTPPLA